MDFQLEGFYLENLPLLQGLEDEYLIMKPLLCDREIVMK